MVASRSTAAFPRTLTLISAVFVCGGLFVAFQMISTAAVRGEALLHPGVLSLPIGLGLLRASRAWRIVALVATGLGLAAAVVLGGWLLITGHRATIDLGIPIPMPDDLDLLALLGTFGLVAFRPRWLVVTAHALFWIALLSAAIAGIFGAGIPARPAPAETVPEHPALFWVCFAAGVAFSMWTMRVLSRADVRARFAPAEQRAAI